MGCPVPAYAAIYAASSFYNFSFGCTPFYSTFHSQQSDLHTFVLRVFLTFSCLPPVSQCSRNSRLPDALREANCHIFGHGPPRKFFWPVIGFLLPLQCQAGMAGLLTSCRHSRETVPLAGILRMRPSEASRFVFCFFHYRFWPKSQSFSVAKIVCGRERLDKP